VAEIQLQSRKLELHGQNLVLEPNTGLCVAEIRLQSRISSWMKFAAVYRFILFE